MTLPERQLANAIRALAMDAVQAANSGHPGMPMGMADVATVLYSDYLKFDPADPKWADRDRFVLSAGHGSMLAYATLHLAGYARPTIGDIRNFRQLHSPCAGHPENFELAGVETTTGPLGQGLATSVGMAIAERHLNALYGDDLVDHRTWVIAGDGCLMEGINHEAIGLAGHLGLGRLTVLWDDNKITIDGSTDLSTSEDIPARYAATGWHVESCDGHDPADIRRAIDAALADPRWSAEPFDIPADIASAWVAFGEKGKALHAEWNDRLASNEKKEEFEGRLSGKVVPGDAFKAYLDGLVAEPPKVATRKASENTLGALTADIASLVGGSADLTGSNNTKTSSTKPLTKDDYSGRYIYYGIREFGMAAAMNGMALHGGVVPYGGTFLVFADYCRAAIRLSALQQQRVVYVMTHDSIGLGEDGPTHQPIEHLQSLRAMPNLLVMRPADAVETAECWALALAQESRPSLLALTRQNLPPLRHDVSENLCLKGGYRLRDAAAARKVVLVATGSEVSLAIEVADKLEAAGQGADVVSMVSTELFDEQSAAYQADILPEDALIVSIEAGTTFGWERYTGRQGLRFGIDSFGASAPIEDLFKHFGLTADAITPQILARLGN